MASFPGQYAFLAVLILLCGRTDLNHIAAADSNPLNLTNAGIVSVADVYAIWTEQSGSNTTIVLLGRNDQATLFAAGHLLRLLSMIERHLELPADLWISSAPEVVRSLRSGWLRNHEPPFASQLSITRKLSRSFRRCLFTSFPGGDSVRQTG